ncbi:MAG: DNA polymerase III subunit gamma/tau [Eubacteriales bacterium]
MAYLALYREWRPKNFEEIVGQEHVKITLSNAVLQGKVAHAYLFSGPRGTGKTSAAKILAKALNCKNRRGFEPCNECESCKSIDRGLALDVMEIDAASNRGIDEIRDLREKVKLVSAGGNFKVYIIDEVHMLTTEAFNALLKTLEEPPVGVVFVLATTEAHKVPLTILSRVQRFEFHRISVALIVKRLEEVCEALGRGIENKALQVIASKAEGGMRDALSILDQCLITEGDISLEYVHQVLGMVGETFSADLIDALLEKNYGKILDRLDEGIALGRDPRQILKELLDYLRQMLIYAASGQESYLDSEVAERLHEQSKSAGVQRLLTWINVLLKGEGELRFASNARLASEMLLVQAIYEERDEKIVGSKQIQNMNSEERVAPNMGAQRIENDEVALVSKAEYIRNVEPKIATEKKLAVVTNGDIKIEDIDTNWNIVLEKVRKIKKSTHAFLLKARPVDLAENNLSLVFKEGYSFHRDKFNQPENKDIVESVLEEVFGQRLVIMNIMESELESKKKLK